MSKLQPWQLYSQSWTSSEWYQFVNGCGHSDEGGWHVRPPAELVISQLRTEIMLSLITFGSAVSVKCPVRNLLQFWGLKRQNDSFSNACDSHVGHHIRLVHSRLLKAALWNRALHYIFAVWFLLFFPMAALRSRCGHYIFALWFLSFFLFFPRLISVAADWMSNILRHMVWP